MTHNPSASPAYGDLSLVATAVEEVARLAGGIAARAFRSTLHVMRKADGSPVTDADRAAERAAREWIETRFPHDGILGEEFGAARPEAARQWIIDPIDGTKTFVHGVPLYGTLVAVASGERILAGCIHVPSLDETVVAARGLGCWWNGTRAAVSTVEAIEAATVLTTDARFGSDAIQRASWDRLASRAGMARTWGDCYGYLLVATGRAEVMLDGRLGTWDAAAVQVAIEEAGGVFTDWRGVATAFGGSAIATNAVLAAEVRSILGARRPAGHDAAH
ncbi:MAG TPA: inositol monophosphatase family protein [Gemmatimonadaceae bacterium]|nr:inositol monophosphatase family protein [Gemmatimonadaceae bacterium]